MNISPKIEVKIVIKSMHLHNLLMFFLYRFWHQFLRRFCINFGALLAQFKVILAPFWDHWLDFWSILAPFWPPKVDLGAQIGFGMHFGTVLGVFWCFLAPFWLHFGSVFASLWYLFLAKRKETTISEKKENGTKNNEEKRNETKRKETNR